LLTQIHSKEIETFDDCLATENGFRDFTMGEKEVSEILVEPLQSLVDFTGGGVVW